MTLKMKTFFSFGTIAALALTLSTAVASAAVVSFHGTDYDLTTVTGKFSDLDDASIVDGTRLSDQVWWESQSTAAAFATLLADALGYPNNGNSFGPYFAYTATSTSVSAGFERSTTCSRCGSTIFFSPTSITTFAVVAPSQVPLPAGSLLLISGLGAAAGLHARKKSKR